MRESVTKSKDSRLKSYIDRLTNVDLDEESMGDDIFLRNDFKITRVAFANKIDDLFD